MTLNPIFSVMAGFIPAIHVGVRRPDTVAVGPTWMPATRAGMTNGFVSSTRRS